MATPDSTKTPTQSPEATRLNDREQQLLEAFKRMPENGQAHMVGFLRIFKALPKKERTTVRMLQIAIDLAPDFDLSKEQIDCLNAQLDDALSKEAANG